MNINLIKPDFINEQESKSNLKIIAAEINNLHTEIVLGEFLEEYVLIITQCGKLGSLLKITQDNVLNNGINNTVFTVKLIFGADSIKQQAIARYIVEKLNIKHSQLMIFLNLQNYDQQTALQVTDLLLSIIKR